MPVATGILAERVEPCNSDTKGCRLRADFEKYFKM